MEEREVFVLPDDKEITELYLYERELTWLPPEIGQFSSLVKLYLRGNQLSSLPPEIGMLSSLMKLNLSYNQLSSLPPEIGTLSSLTDLYLNGNQLSSLPREIGKLSSLKKLYLANNRLTNLPKEIGKLENLICLGLYRIPTMVYPPRDDYEDVCCCAKRVVHYCQEHDNTISKWGRFNTMWNSFVLLFIARHDEENCADTFARLPIELLWVIQEYAVSDPFVPIETRIE